MARKGERALNIGSASPLGDFGNSNDLKDIEVYERHTLVFERILLVHGVFDWHNRARSDRAHDGVIIFGSVPGPIRRVSEAGGVPTDVDARRMKGRERDRSSAVTSPLGPKSWSAVIEGKNEGFRGEV